MFEHLSVKVTKVIPLSNYRIQVLYEDGKEVIYDVKQDIQNIKAFQKLSDETEFRKVYIGYQGYSIAWGDGDPFSDVDMDSEVPYLEGELVSV